MELNEIVNCNIIVMLLLGIAEFLQLTITDGIVFLPLSKIWRTEDISQIGECCVWHQPILVSLKELLESS